MKEEERLLRVLGIDLLLARPDYKDPRMRKMPDGSHFDALGKHLRSLAKQLQSR